MIKLIAQGAEAKIFLEKNQVVKDRFRKSYRISEIDTRLRKSRTKREAKVLLKLQKLGFPTPSLIDNDEKSILKMSYINGKLVKHIINDKNGSKLAKEIGEKIARLHNNTIIHGDLTTSNMIMGKEIYFIDFGLSFFSHKIEDMAVDLHLLKEALESKHPSIFEKTFGTIKKYYKIRKINGADVLKRLEQVESRGRYKGKK